MQVARVIIFLFRSSFFLAISRINIATLRLHLLASQSTPGLAPVIS